MPNNRRENPLEIQGLGVTANLTPKGTGSRLDQWIETSHEAALKLDGERAFLASAVEASDDAIIGLQSDGTVASWNRGARKLYGYEADEIVGHDYSVLIPADRPAELRQFRDALKSGGKIRHSGTERLAKDGTKIPVSLTFSSIFDGQGALVGGVVVARDISAQKQIEDELYQSRQMLRFILDSIPQRVFWKDQDLLYLGCNKAFASDAGLTDPTDIVWMDDFDFPWSPSAHLYRADDRRVMETGLSQLDFVEEQRRPDGSMRWLRTSKVPLHDRAGSIAGVLGTYEDITERKIADEALRASEERYRLLFERNLAGVFRTNVEGQIVECNEAAARILGYSVQETLALRSQDLHYTNSQRDAFLTKLQSDGRLTNYELRLRNKAGHPVWVIANVTLLPSAHRDQAILEGTLIDITDRKRAEDALAEEAALAMLRAEVGAALTGGSGMRPALQECAEALVRRTGVAFARIWTANIPGSMLQLEASAGLYTHINGGHAVVPVGKFKIGRIAQDGQAHVTNDVHNDDEVSDQDWARREGLVSFVGYPLLVENRVIGVVAAFGRQLLSGATIQSFSSVAGQIARFVHGKRAQEALQRSEEHARLLFTSIPHPAYVFDLDTQKFLVVNDLAVERYGYARDEFLEMTVADLLASIDGGGPLGAEPAPHNADAWQESKHRTKDGRVIETETTVHTLEYDGHRAALVIAQDITKRKKLELDLRHAQKLEAVGGLAAGIAHEINTPVQFVGDNLRFLQESFESMSALLDSWRAMGRSVDGDLAQQMEQAAAKAELDYFAEEIPKAVSQSLDGVERVAVIVKAMKEFAHPDQKQRVAADLNRALASTLVVARNELKYVADVETDFGEIPPVECYPSDLNQVFLNLLINAAHAVQDAVGGVRDRGMIRVQTQHCGESVRITISDTGCGIPEAIRDKIFDPFFTTKKVGRGTGQGLAIARSIVVDKHGGTMTFESTVGQGTTFTIDLPIVGRAAEPDGGTVDITQEARSGDGRRLSSLLSAFGESDEADSVC